MPYMDGKGMVESEKHSAELSTWTSMGHVTWMSQEVSKWLVNGL